MNKKRMIVWLACILWLTVLWAGDFEKDARFALSLYKDKRFSLAEQQFRMVLEKYPDNAMKQEFHFFLGEALFYQEKYDESIVQYQQFLRNYPVSRFHEKVLFHLGQGYYFQQNYDEAIDRFEQIQSTHALFWDAQYLIGISLLEQGKLLDAQPYFDQVMNSNQPLLQGKSLLAQGRAFFQQKEYQKAIEFLHPLTEDTDLLPVAVNEALFLQALAHYNLNDYEAAVQTFQELLLSGPETNLIPKIHYFTAECYYQLKRYEEAKDFYRKNKDLYPDSEWAAPSIEALARTELEQQNWTAAAEHFQVLQSDYSDSAEGQNATYFLGLIAHKQENFDAAKNHFQTYIDRYTEHEFVPQAAYELAKIFYDHHEWGQAILYFDLIAEKFPSGEFGQEAMFFAGEALYYQGKMAEAILQFNRLHLLYPHTEFGENALLRVGELMLQKKVVKEAQSKFEELVSQGQNEALKSVALAYLGEMALQQNRFSRADSLFSRAEMLAGENETLIVQAFYGKAWSAFQGGDYLRAKQLFAEIENRFPQSERTPEAAQKIGDCYLNIKEYALARSSYLHVKEQYPQSEFALLAYFMVGETYYNEDNFEMAKQFWINYADNYRHSNWADKALYRAAEADIAHENYVGALASLSRLQELFPASLFTDKAQLKKGDCLYNQQKYNEAIQAYLEVFQISTNEALQKDALKGIFWAYRQIGQPEGALSVMNSLQERYQGCPFLQEMQLLQAELLMETKQYGQAIVLLQKLLAQTESETSKVAIYEQLITAYMQADRSVEAVQTLTELIALPDLDPTIRIQYFNQLGQIHMQQSHYGQAATIYRQLFKITQMDSLVQKWPPEYAAEALWGEGLARFKAKQYALAAGIFHELAEYKVDDYPARAYLHLGRIALQERRYGEAKTFLEKVLHFSAPQQEAEAELYLGEVFFAQNRFEEALVHYLRVVYLYVDFPQTLFGAKIQAVKCYQKLGQNTEANQLLRDLNNMPNLTDEQKAMLEKIR